MSAWASTFRRGTRAWLALALLLLCACSEPLPPEKIAYAGEWRGDNVRLIITPDGRIDYERQDGKSRVSVRAPIQRFEGDNFVAGIGPLSTKFVVSQPPRLVDGVYKMVVDGMSLTRVRSFEGARV
jgi:hypothetical protein